MKYVSAYQTTWPNRTQPSLIWWIKQCVLLHAARTTFLNSRACARYRALENVPEAEGEMEYTSS